MSKLKNWVIGVCMIVVAVGGFLLGSLGGGEKKSIGETVDQVKQGIEVIKKADEEKSKTETAKTEEVKTEAPK